MRGSSIIIACALLGGCAGAIVVNKPPTAPEPKPPPYAGDVASKPSLEALPGLDVSEDELTREMRMARMLSLESLNVPDPPVCADHSSASIEAWSGRELKEWIERKQRAAEAARAELDKAALQSHRQRIVAGALVGLVYEDLARVLLELPVPADLESEPEVAEVYREVLARQAAPYLLQAKYGYDACAGNARQVAALQHWSSFCTARSEGLKPPSGVAKQGAGETTVSVAKSP